MSAEVSEANKVRAKIMDAVKRQSEQLVVAFLKAAANNERSTVDEILDQGSIEVDDSDGVVQSYEFAAVLFVLDAILVLMYRHTCRC